jgi:hypothetical protein
MLYPYVDITIGLIAQNDIWKIAQEEIGTFNRNTAVITHKGIFLMPNAIIIQCIKLRNASFTINGILSQITIQ